MIGNCLVEVKRIGKSFGAVHALQGVDFRVGAGEVVGLLGDNGAGKSTLVNILSGVTQPDTGEIIIRGSRCRLRNTRAAIAAGIETIFQGAALVDQLSISRNIFLGREPTRYVCGIIPELNSKFMRDEVATLLKKIGLEKDFDPDQSIAGLSGGERQAIAIARAMFFEAELILLDEPTNNLGVEETRRVLDFIREARDAGRSSVLITHSIVHALQVVDRIVILRRGRVAAELDSAEVQLEDIELLITG